jgi:hypothetical protein
VASLDANGTVTLSGNRQDVFSLPFDATLENIYMTVNSRATFTFPSGITVRPFLELYTAAPDSNVFTPVPSTKLTVQPGYSGGPIPSNTAQAASVRQIGLQLTAGTRVLIGGHLEISGTGPLLHTYYFYFTGGIALKQQ